MNTTELKALADDIVLLWDNGSFEREDAEEAKSAILALIAALESAQGERRALLATEQNLRERVKALEEGIKNLSKVKGRFHTEQAYKSLVALLEKTT